MRKFLLGIAAALAAALLLAGPAQPQAAQTAAASLKFAVIGDNGTGAAPQYEVAQQMIAARATFPYDLVLMLGDNMYGRQSPGDFVDKFEKPYAALLGSGVRFFATLGNHDEPSNRDYPGFNMGGQRYYTFVRQPVRFFVFDSNLMDRDQVAWIERTLPLSDASWKICYFHHPLYSNAGRHGSDVELRVVLEPLLVKNGVDVVFSGHEHVYERLKPQKGITYFIEGASGQLRKGDVTPSGDTAASFDQDRSFMLVDVAGDTLTFRTISRTGTVVDSGTVHIRPTT
jgi:3',5'-cyclic AMP phosphodiesterase CpdA